MKEEKERKLFARKNDRICLELISKIEEWERELRMPFMYRGMHYKHVLQAEQGKQSRRGTTSLTRSNSREGVAPGAGAGTSPRSGAAATAAGKTPATAPRPASAVARKEGVPSRRLSGTGTNTERKKQLEEWRANNDKKKEAAAAKETPGSASQPATKATPTGIPGPPAAADGVVGRTRRRLSVGESAAEGTSGTRPASAKAPAPPK
jgi:hypothetical protein